MKNIFDYLKENKAVRDFLDEYGPQLKKAAVICLVGLVLFAGFSLFKSSDGLAEASDKGGNPSIQSDEYDPERSLSEQI